MLTKPSLAGLKQDQADAMTTLFLEYMNETAILADVAPPTAPLHKQPPPSLLLANPTGSEDSRGSGAAASAQVQPGEGTREQERRDEQMKAAEEAENKRQAQEINDAHQGNAAKRGGLAPGIQASA